MIVLGPFQLELSILFYIYREENNTNKSCMIHSFWQKLPLIHLHPVRTMIDLPKASEHWKHVNKAIFSERFEFKIYRPHRKFIKQRRCLPLVQSPQKNKEKKYSGELGQNTGHTHLNFRNKILLSLLILWQQVIKACRGTVQRNLLCMTCPPSLSQSNFDFSIDFMGSTDAPADPAAGPSLT